MVAKSTKAGFPAGATSWALMASSSVQHRREVGAGRLIVETDRHQIHLMREAETVPQTPAKQLPVARRQQKTPAVEGRCGADQRLEALVGLGDRVPEKCNIGSIGCDFAEMLDDACRPLLDRIAKLAPTIVPMDPLAQRVAGSQIRFCGRPHVVTWKSDAQGRSVQLRNRLAGLEAELGVQAQRSIVVGRLQQPDPGE